MARALHVPKQATLSSVAHGASSASRVTFSPFLAATVEKTISPGSGVRKILTSLATAAAHPLLGADVGFTLMGLIF